MCSKCQCCRVVQRCRVSKSSYRLFSHLYHLSVLNICTECLSVVFVVVVGSNSGQLYFVWNTLSTVSWVSMALISLLYAYFQCLQSASREAYHRLCHGRWHARAKGHLLRNNRFGYETGNVVLEHGVTIRIHLTWVFGLLFSAEALHWAPLSRARLTICRVTVSPMAPV